MRVLAGTKPDGAKLKYVDSLRGIAILMVILTHANRFIANLQQPVELLSDYGQMGVQLFFIVSAFTLCLTFDKRNMEEKGLSKFYIRRYFRIAPLYYFGILLYLAYFSLFEPMLYNLPSEWDERYNLRNILVNMFLVNDFTPGPANNKIVPGGWSIGTETSFYILFPFIFSLYQRFGTNHWALLLLPLIAIAGCFVIVQIVLAATGMTAKNNSFLYFNIVCQLPVFLFGMSLYFLLKLKHRFTQLKPRVYAVGFLLSTLVAFVVYAYTSEMAFFVPIAAGFSFLFLFMLFKTSKRTLFKMNWLSRIGQLSYSIYLFHFIFAWVGSKLLWSLMADVASSEIIYLTNVLLTVVLTVGVALFSEKYIEKPGINLGRKLITYLEARKATGNLQRAKRRLILDQELNRKFEIN